jgi:hypothetical protein
MGCHERGMVGALNLQLERGTEVENKRSQGRRLPNACI